MGRHAELNYKKAEPNSLKIVEGVEGVWRYHLSESGDTARPALCGNSKVMTTKIPLDSWNKKDEHIPSSYCKTCNHIYQRNNSNKV
jgi:hypothetical protein